MLRPSSILLFFLPCLIFASDKVDLTGRWDWIKSYRGGFAGGWETPADLGYSKHMIIRNDSVYTYNGDTLKQSDSLSSLITAEYGTEIDVRADTLVITQTRIEASPASYWLKATPSDKPSEIPPIPFVCSWVNYAWGYSHHGLFIDSTGMLYTFSFAQSDSIGYFNMSNPTPSAVYNKLFEKGVATGKTVSRDTLILMQSLVDSAAAGTLTLGGGCNDFGIYRYSAFMRRGLNNEVTEAICHQIGDETICNSSSAAKTIAGWLNTIDSVDLDHCTPGDACLVTPTAAGGTYLRQELPQSHSRAVYREKANAAASTVRVYSLRGELLSTSVAKSGITNQTACKAPGIRHSGIVIVNVTDGTTGSAVSRAVVSPDR